MVKLERVGPLLWRIPPDARPGMRVPGLVVADELLMDSIRSEFALEQLANGATLPGIVKAALAMPDIHQGYGLPVGGVVATDADRGVVCPGAIGLDINCGVRLLRTALESRALDARLSALVEALWEAIPSGVGSRGGESLSSRDLDGVMEHGATWSVERGQGCAEDLAAIESRGWLGGASPDSVSAHAREGGRRQARPWTPPRPGSPWAPCAPPATSRSPTGRRWRTGRGRRSSALGMTATDLDMAVVYDVAHNIAKEEDHVVDGRPRRLLVHRKGATRAFPGQPVLVPGDMGRASYVLVGTEAAMRETFGSTCHGAGRLLSRTAAVRAARGRQIDRELLARGVVARATGRDALAEEMPEAYKDVQDVVSVVHRFGISTRVARLRPVGVVKG